MSESWLLGYIKEVYTQLPDDLNAQEQLPDLENYLANRMEEEISRLRSIKKSMNNYDIESRRDWLLDKLRYAASQNSCNTTNQFWQQDNHTEELLRHKFIQQNLDYIHENPVKEGWVEEVQHYL